MAKEIDLTGIDNVNEYYTNHYLNTIFAENIDTQVKVYKETAKEEESKTPWSKLKAMARHYYAAHEHSSHERFSGETLEHIERLAQYYLDALGYPALQPETITLDGDISVPVALEIKKASGAPLLWVLLSASHDLSASVMAGHFFDASLGEISLTEKPNEEMVGKILFDQQEPPRWLLIIGLKEIVLVDRNKWDYKRMLSFDMETIFSRNDDSTWQAMSVLLHHDSLCPAEGKSLLDELDEASEKNAEGVSEDLKYALRESIELLGNEVLYDLRVNKGQEIKMDSEFAGQLTLECLRYMYRMLFVFFMESREDLGYAPMKAASYVTGYSLESLRQIAEQISIQPDEKVLEGTFVGDTLGKLFDIIYTGYPATEEGQNKWLNLNSHRDDFLLPPLKAHIFDPERTKMVHEAKLRNRVMLRIINLMSLTRDTGKKNARRGRISYANLGINQMGAVYEALLSYRGFIADTDLYEVKRAKDKFNELDVGYFVKAEELDNYTEDERARYETGEKKGQLRVYEKGTFIYRLAGREREKSASYYTPEVLTKCLVKYALKELLVDKSADEILQLTVCEPAMGSAAFLNEAINQLAEAYLQARQKELVEQGEKPIAYDERKKELQKIKMFIADRNVYGVDLNSTAVELAEVSLWLNTIHEGGLVPWFGTQLVNGNSLIGARRECYHVDALRATAKGTRWHENAPERMKLTERRGPKSQVYHFLTGDPGMANYTDKVIKDLEPENIKKIKAWQKGFTKPYDGDDIKVMLHLSQKIDDLWEQQVELRKEIEAETRDNLSIYGHKDDTVDSHTSIRKKDEIYRKGYKSEEQKNAGPYARLRFAMDYWCALWFWPIEKADMLPTRDEFLAEMGFIIEGVVNTNSSIASLTDETYQVSLFNHETQKQLNIFDSLREEAQDAMMEKIRKFYPQGTVVDLEQLITLFPRLALVKEIAKNNKFLHWELEFADIFKERDGFDLMVGNPPWIKIEWNEQSLLSDANPMFAVKKLSATETTKQRTVALEDGNARKMYLEEYVEQSGLQNFLNSVANYHLLKGQKTNLYKCFLPQAWNFCNERGFSGFVHPEGVYDDPNGGALREKLYQRIRKHFMFANELKFFHEVDHHTTFSVNVYGGPRKAINFDTISNLYAVSTLDQCYDGDIKQPVPGIKNKDNKWETKGHPDRIIKVTSREMKIFAYLIDGSKEWCDARLPVVHAKELVETMDEFVRQESTLNDFGNEVLYTFFWNETIAQENGIIARDIHFPNETIDTIYSGPHIGVSNPLFKCSRRVCVLNSDYDNIDLTAINDCYIQRVNYIPHCSMEEYNKKVPRDNNGELTNKFYRIVARKRLNLTGERTLISAIIPPQTAHIIGLTGLEIKDYEYMLILNGQMSSLPFDFFVKIMGQSDFVPDNASKLPYIRTVYDLDIKVRSALLNMVSKNYQNLYEETFDNEYNNIKWAKSDPRLRPERFTTLTDKWTWDTPLRTDYERRQALVELDVLTAMALGMNLDQLKTIYRIQFPVLQSYEADTWYDANGRIAFTINRSLIGVGVDRPTWENTLRQLKPGETYRKTYTDDTQPGGPVERTIEYVAPFDRCDREEDYETVWKFFSEKYGE
ncbi:Eco57I restriction-modification methylase domain-containing protein [Selenomonas ruminantium]|uniref:site-specific DNA-methyltransferase (adenine-specific) n=1 Tax=Selenomonas ruminantium TaxID=971 RepID=A0A1I0Y4B2_SELRU|nr:N-6 DNA methylase [Selenomonas ruminantium]SFB07258.1 N-6 DNA Methylase [Selenomonas ruminantium]